MPIYIKAVKGILLFDIISLNKSYSDLSYSHATYPKYYGYILWLEVYIVLMDSSGISSYIMLQFVPMVFFIISIFGIIFF